MPKPSAGARRGPRSGPHLLVAIMQENQQNNLFEIEWNNYIPGKCGAAMFCIAKKSDSTPFQNAGVGSTNLGSTLRIHLSGSYSNII